MRTLGITLAKGHSRGVPNKNLGIICGKPLLGWTLKEAIRTHRLDGYAVSSEDEDILGYAGSFSAKIDLIKRRKEYSQDDTPSLDALDHSLQIWNSTWRGFKYDAIALIPCTTPLRTAKDIDNAIRMLEDNPGSDSVIGVTECDYVERVKHIRDGLITDIVPEPQDGQRQNLEKCYTRSGIYVVRRDSLDKLFGHKNSLAYILPPERGINIDTMLDFKIAEMLLEERGGL